MKAPEEYYEKKKRKLWELYWKNNKGNIYLPNGFISYPHEIYDLFMQFIDHDGKVLDLGCGNGLMLNHLVKNSGHKLIPYGVDFIEESIEQAKKVILPEFAENFKVANIKDYVEELEENSFDFIFFDPYDLHPNDLPRAIERIVRACKPGGKIIFYTYSDVIEELGITWVGDMLPEEIRKRLKRFDHEEVSTGIFEK